MLYFFINLLGTSYQLMQDLLVASFFFTSHFLYFSSLVGPLNTSPLGTLLPSGPEYAASTLLAKSSHNQKHNTWLDVCSEFELITRKNLSEPYQHVVDYSKTEILFLTREDQVFLPPVHGILGKACSQHAWTS